MENQTPNENMTIEHIPEHIPDNVEPHQPLQQIDNKFTIKRYTKKKDGEVSTYQYNQRQYNNVWYMNHKNILQNKIVCQCGKEHTQQNRTNHYKTKRHIKYLESLNTPPTAI